MWFRRRSPLDEFFTTFRGRSLLVHRGLDPEWLRRLLEQGGGAAHFRLHVERQDGRHRPTPVEIFVHRHLLPHGLPLPLLVKVGEGECRVRHLIEGGYPFAAELMPLVAEELEARHHLRLVRQGAHCLAHPGTLVVEDNSLQFPEPEDPY